MNRMKVEFPLEMTAEILSRLPVDSIVECKLVCKTWRTLINNDFRSIFPYNTSSTTAESSQPFGFFTLTENQLCYGEYYYSYTTTTTSTHIIIDDDHDHEKEKEKEKEEAHLKVTKPFKYPPLPHHPFYKEEVLTTKWAILGSSNGLICLSACRWNAFQRKILFTYNIYVYNPMTTEFVDVGTEAHMAAVGGRRASGFGYLPSTNEYKIIRINYETHSSPTGQVKVYTLGSGASRWTDKGEIPYVIKGVKKPGVLVNGALHWITRDRNILSFDLADEEFRIVSKPWLITGYNSTRLGVLRGCLSAGINVGNGRTNVWIMNNNKSYMSSSSSNINNRSSTTDGDNDDDHDNEPSWIRLPIAFHKPPNRYDIDNWDFSEISSYGLKYESFSRFFYSNPETRLHLHLVPYTISFVSLKALGEENVKKIC